MSHEYNINYNFYLSFERLGCHLIAYQLQAETIWTFYSHFPAFACYMYIALEKKIFI